MIALTCLLVVVQSAVAQPRMRARDLGVAPGIFLPGRLNGITDVPGVKVGQITVVR
ncbi:MAG: S58 family peptidase, partial [Gemmatimonadota bacterium]|nr:S58 family peptidase [Gemmatimonadota bacterium]